MVLVGSSGLLMREGEGLIGADLQRVQRDLVDQALSADRLSCVGGALVVANSTPRQWCQVQGKYMGLSSGVYVIKLIEPY